MAKSGLRLMASEMISDRSKVCSAQPGSHGEWVVTGALRVTAVAVTRV